LFRTAAERLIITLGADRRTRNYFIIVADHVWKIALEHCGTKEEMDERANAIIDYNRTHPLSAKELEYVREIARRHRLGE
jgi:hypothetical protein